MLGNGVRFRRSWLFLLVAVLMAASMYWFFFSVDAPAQEAAARAKNSPRGNLSGLYPAWLGARELLINKRDPYSKEVTEEIQKGVWGRPLDSGNPSDPKDESRFAYPLYVVFILAPCVGFSFPVVKAAFIAIAYLCLVASVWLWLRMLAQNDSRLAIAAASILFVGSYSGIVVVEVQQLAVVILAVIAGAMMAVTRGKLGLAGVLLALATIKPQSVMPIIAWLLLWALSNWKERKALWISFSLTSAVLLAGAELLMPGWIWEWREALSAYMRYAPIGGAYVDLIFGSTWGKVVAGVMIMGICVFCWRGRNDSPHSDRFKLAASLILSANLLINPVWHTYDHIFNLPAALLLFHWRDQFFRLRPLGRAVVGLAAFAVFWQWGAAAAVSIVGLVSPKSAWNLQIVPWLSMFFFAPLAFASLVLMGRARLSGAADPGWSKRERLEVPAVNVG